jgi:hypothetical protein
MTKDNALNAYLNLTWWNESFGIWKTLKTLFLQHGGLSGKGKTVND